MKFYPHNNLLNNISTVFLDATDEEILKSSKNKPEVKCLIYSVGDKTGTEFPKL